jgi:transcriptional regulator with XRE-family HTH domain
MTRRLDNYLRSHRKHRALSQDDVARLIGARCGSTVSRYESFARRPSLEMAVAFALVLDVPLRELFVGLHEQVEMRVRRRARALLRSSVRTGFSPRATSHLQRLAA